MRIENRNKPEMKRKQNKMERIDTDIVYILIGELSSSCLKLLKIPIDWQGLHGGLNCGDETDCLQHLIP